MNEQQRKAGVWLAADTMDGVFSIDPIDYPTMEVMRPSDFYKSLTDLSDGEIIFAFFDGNDEDIFNKIDSEYGICR